MKKIQTDWFGYELRKGSIVRYKDGWLRISAIFPASGTANLCGIFSGKIFHKKVPIAEIYEDEKSWYEHWQQSETYKSM